MTGSELLPHKCSGIELVMNAEVPIREIQLLFTRYRAQNSKGSDRLPSFLVQPETASNFPTQSNLYTLLPGPTVSTIIRFLF